ACKRRAGLRRGGASRRPGAARATTRSPPPVAASSGTRSRASTRCSSRSTASCGAPEDTSIMSLLDSIRYRLRVFARSRQHEQDLAEEMEFFVSAEAREREHAAHGELSANAARDAARRRFGNATYYREEARRISGLEVVDTLIQDAAFALRTFARTP